jgi:hypothetical protein
MRLRTIICVLCVGMCVAACDNKKPAQGGKSHQEETSSGGFVSQLLQESFPKDLRPQYLEYKGQVWLDFIFNYGCMDKGDYSHTKYLHVFYRDDAEAWPDVGEVDDISEMLKHQVPLSGTLKSTLVPALARTGIIRETTQSGFVGSLTCFTLFTDKIGTHFYNYHRKSDNKESRGLIAVGGFIFDHYKKISEFERMVPSKGFVAKQQKYKLFAHIQGNELLGNRRIDLERDLLIYFDVEDNAWREEGPSSDEHAWHLVSNS